MMKTSKEDQIFSVKQHIVEIQVIINKIGPINTLDGTFYAEFYLQATWSDKLKEYNRYKKLNFLYDAKKHFNPNIVIANAIDEPIDEIQHVCRQSHHRPDEIFITEKRKISGMFWHEFNLKYFPIDVQSLGIVIKSSHTLREVLFTESKEKFSCLSSRALVNADEWTLQSCVTVNASIAQNEISMDNYSIFTVGITASRIPKFYFYNLFLLIFLITVIGLSRFTVTCDLPQVRLIIDQMVTLTLVTFKSVVNANLPTISYLTSVDKYLLFSIIFIMIQCIYDALIGVVAPAGCVMSFGFYDMLAFVISVGMIFTANLFFAVWLMFFALKKRKQLYKEIDLSNYSNSDRMFNYYENSLTSSENSIQMKNESKIHEDSDQSSETNSVYFEIRL